MAPSRSQAFDALLSELRVIGAEALADQLEQLGAEATLSRLREGVNAMCRGLPTGMQAADSLRKYRDGRL